MMTFNELQQVGSSALSTLSTVITLNFVDCVDSVASVYRPSVFVTTLVNNITGKQLKLSSQIFQTRQAINRDR